MTAWPRGGGWCARVWRGGGGVAAAGGGVAAAGGGEAASGTEVVPVGGAPNVSHASSRSPGNCAGVIGRPDGVTGPPSPASPSSRALRRQRGPTHSSRCSSSSSQAACADGGRSAGVLASSPSTQAAIGAGTSARDLGQRHRRLLAVREQDRDRLAVAERHRAREQLVGDHAGRVEVGPRPDALAHRLLGRHVGGRPDRGARGGAEGDGAAVDHRLRDPEVRDLHASVVGDHQVLGLEVPVHDVVGVGVREAGEDALEHAADLRQRELADPRPQRAARDVLHRDVGRAVVLEEVEHGDDARVVQRAGEP